MKWYLINPRDSSSIPSLETTQADFNGFDPERLYLGERIDDWPPGVVFFQEKREKFKRVDDVLMNVYANLSTVRVYLFPIYSQRLQEGLLSAQIKDFQFLPVSVRDFEGNYFKGYAIANVLTFRDALDVSHSKVIYWDDTLPRLNVVGNVKAIVTPALRKSRVQDCDAFRLPEDARNLFVSDRFHKLYRKLKATGISFRPAQIIE